MRPRDLGSFSLESRDIQVCKQGSRPRAWWKSDSTSYRLGPHTDGGMSCRMQNPSGLVIVLR